MRKTWILFVVFLLLVAGGFAVAMLLSGDASAQNEVVTLPLVTKVPLGNTRQDTPEVVLDSTPKMLILETAVITPSPPAIPTPTTVANASQPEVTATAISEPAWLNYLNQFRRLADLPLLVEDPDLTVGTQLHSEYMAVQDDPDARYQSQSSAYYSAEGDIAARNSNIVTMTSGEGGYDWAINYWMTAPFNIVPILDPRLQSVGFGYFEDDAGDVKATAVLDVNSGINEAIVAEYPITFPQDGGKTWLNSYDMYEFPNPLTVCDKYQQPTGPPLILQLGPDFVDPVVSNHRLMQGTNALASCVLYGENYENDDEYARDMGRAVLNGRGAIVIIPERPLDIGNTYTVSVDVNGETYEWTFTSVTRPDFLVTPKYEAPEDIVFAWPVTNHEVYLEYVPQHTGIDLLMPEGSPIVASEDGVVFFRGWDDRGYGNTIILDHGEGIRTLYAHLQSFNVPHDALVKQGEIIGTVGSTGNSDIPHVHFEVHLHYYRPVDPCDHLATFFNESIVMDDSEQEPPIIFQQCGKMLVTERP